MNASPQSQLQAVSEQNKSRHNRADDCCNNKTQATYFKNFVKLQSWDIAVLWSKYAFKKVIRFVQT